MTLLNSVFLSIIICIILISFIPRISNIINSSRCSILLTNPLQKVYEKNYYIFLFFVIVIGLTVRVYKFGSIPGGINQDEAMAAVDAFALGSYGTDRFGMYMPVHFTAWGYAQMNVLMSYITIPFIKLFGLSKDVARLPTLFISLTSLWALYSLCRIYLDKNISVLILTLCVINPWHIMQSRWALESNLFPHFILFSMLFFHLGFARNRIYYYISMIFFGLAMYTYGIAWFTMPIFLFSIFMYLWLKRIISLKHILIMLIIYLIISLPIYGLILVNYFKMPTVQTPIFSIPYFPDNSRTTEILFFSYNIFDQLRDNIIGIYKVIIRQEPDLPWNSIPEYGIIYLFGIPLFLYGLTQIIRLSKIRKSLIIKSLSAYDYNCGTNFFYFSLLVWLFCGVITGSSISYLNVNKINIIIYPLIIITGIGIYYLVNKIKISTMILVIMFIVSFFGFCQSYFGEHSKILAKKSYDGFGDAIEYINDFEQDYIYITPWTQDKSSADVSEILTLFYHNIDAKYFQGISVPDSKSVKKILPYKDRYKYIKIDKLDINPRDKAVYIVRNEETTPFDDNIFFIKKFNNYSAVIPYNMLKDRN